MTFYLNFLFFLSFFSVHFDIGANIRIRVWEYLCQVGTFWQILSLPCFLVTIIYIISILVYCDNCDNIGLLRDTNFKQKVEYTKKKRVIVSSVGSVFSVWKVWQSSGKSRSWCNSRRMVGDF